MLGTGAGGMWEVLVLLAHAEVCVRAGTELCPVTGEPQ